MKRPTVIILFAAILLTGLNWLFMVPIWQTPDEQSHFAQVAFLSLKGRNPGLDQFDTTEEIYISQIHLGTARDASGNNKFTFHPEYKIDYTKSLYGYYEASISSLAHTQAQSRLVISEASHYPILYYFPASKLYQLFSSFDIFTRIYIVRLYSLLFFLCIAIFTYKIGKLLFPDNNLLQMVFTLLVSFHPMMIFSNIGVTSDSLANLLFTYFLYTSAVLIQNGMNKKRIFTLLSIALLALITKFQFITIIPMVVLLILFLIFRDTRKQNKIFLSTVTLLISISLIGFLYLMKFQPILIAFDTISVFNVSSFMKYTAEYTLPHTYKEVLPWYWGIYKWLGVTYPRFIHRIINYVTLFSSMGFIYWFIQKIVAKQLSDKRFQTIIILLLFHSIYFVALSYFDWKSWHQTGFQLGIQGRYFFPFIIVHMLIICRGLNTLLLFIRPIRIIMLKLTGISILLFDLYAFYTVADAYYDLSHLAVYIIQASQYKPWFVKGKYMEFIFLFNLISLLILSASLIIWNVKKPADDKG